MNNKNLLRPFDLAQAEAGAAICWSALDEPVTFVGRTTSESIAIRQNNGFIETTCRTSLRMKPLFWKEGKPVYVGDSLWHTIAKQWIVVAKLQDHPDSEKEGYFIDTDGFNAAATLCTFDTQPVPLFRVEGKDVFAGDKFWNVLYKEWMTIAVMQIDSFVGNVGYFVATDGRHGCLKFCSWEDLSAPLFILDGQPVYKGTRLWHTRDNHWVTVAGMYFAEDFIDENSIRRSPCYCAWEKPKTTVVRYANVYRGSASSGRYLGDLFTTVADAQAVKGSKEGVGVARIEWQE